MPWHIRALNAQGVKAVVNVCEEFEGYTRLYSELGIEQCHLLVPDYCNVNAANIAKGAAFIHKKIQAGDSVYVHCKSGVGRCAMVLVSYVARYHDLGIEEANRYVNSSRNQIIGNVGKRPSVKQFLTLPRET